MISRALKAAQDPRVGRQQLTARARRPEKTNESVRESAAVPVYVPIALFPNPPEEREDSDQGKKGKNGRKRFTRQPEVQNGNITPIGN